jgi:hypothetical protein
MQSPDLWPSAAVEVAGQGQDSFGSTQASASSIPVAPSLSPPRGGGTVDGMGEKFDVNVDTGIRVGAISDLRESGYLPDLSLSYDSGAETVNSDRGGVRIESYGMQRGSVGLN